MVRVKLVQQIYRNCDTKELGAWATRTVKMPYAPFPGLRVFVGSEEQVVSAVKYDVDDRETRCLLNVEGHDDYQHAVSVAKRFGWKVKEIPEGRIQEYLEILF